MSVKYDEKREQELTAHVQELEIKIAERSDFMNQEQASEAEWTEARRGEYQGATLEHARLCRDRDIAKDQLKQIQDHKPMEKLPEVEADPVEDALESFMRGKNGPVNEVFEFDSSFLSRKQRAQEIIADNNSTASAIVPTGTEGSVVDILSRFGDSLMLPAVAVTPDGHPVEYPYADNSDQEGEIVGTRGTQATTQDVNAFGFETLRSFTVGSKKMALPLELQADSNFDITGYTVGTLTRRIGRTLDKLVIKGTGGNNQPQGIDGVAKEVALASATGVSPVVDLINMEFGVGRAYIMGEGGYAGGLPAGSGLTARSGHIGFAFSRGAEKLLRRATDTRGRPLWEPSLQAGGAGRIFGWEYVVSERIDDPASGKRSMFFGNFGYMLLRMISGGGTGSGAGIQIKSFYDSATADRNTVEFVGFTRVDQRSMLKPDSQSKNEAIVAGKHG